MNHSLLVVRYILRKLGWIGTALLGLAILSLASEVHDSKDWVWRAEVTKLTIFCGMVLMGLHWGQEQKMSKVLMLMDSRPSYGLQIILGEALGLWLCGMLPLLLACSALVGGETYWGSKVGALLEASPQKIEIKVEPTRYVLDWQKSQTQQLGIRPAFVEGTYISDVNFLPISTEQGGTYMLKALREVVLPVTPPFILPRNIPRGEGVLSLELLEVRLLQRTGSWFKSVSVWFWSCSMELFVLCVFLILLGKHVSLELGFVAILSILLAQVLMSIYDEGEVGRLLTQLAYLRETGHSYGFKVRWWESCLLQWSQVLQSIMSISMNSQSDMDISVVNHGHALTRAGDFWRVMFSMILGLGLFLGLDHWWKRFRAW